MGIMPAILRLYPPTHNQHLWILMKSLLLWSLGVYSPIIFPIMSTGHNRSKCSVRLLGPYPKIVIFWSRQEPVLEKAWHTSYLLPCGPVKNGQRVIISTNTINLQDQLINKDIPDLRSAMGMNLSAAVMKGRSNYLCPRRLENMRRRGPENADEMRVLGKSTGLVAVHHQRRSE